MLLLALLVAGGYVGLVVYPARAAGDLMRPSSGEFAEALTAYRETVEAFPAAGTDPSTLPEEMSEVLEHSNESRSAISRSQGSLEEREPVRVPIISSRSPLGEAREVRDRMLDFYASALEVIADVESVAGYLTELAASLPQIDNMQRALGRPGRQDGIVTALAAATPIAEQLVADIRTLTPPTELGPFHESLLAIARRIRNDLQQAAETDQPGSSPVVSALLDDVRRELGTIQSTVADAPGLALEGGLGPAIEEVQGRAQAIIDRLEALRAEHGLDGLTIPST